MIYLKLVRFQNLIAMALIQYLIRYALLIPTYGTAAVLGDVEFALLVLSILLIAGGGYVINDYFDIRVDAVNRNVLIGRKIKRRKALILHALLTFTGVVLGFVIAFKVGYIILGVILVTSAYLLWLYSLKLKRKLFVGNFIIAKLSAVFILSIAIFEIAPKLYQKESKQLIVLLCIYALFAFICSLMHEVIKDLKGCLGDKTFEIKTLATEWGITKTKEFVKWLSIVLASMVITVSVYKFNSQIYPMLYAAFFVVAPLFMVNVWIYKADKTEDYSRIALLHKFIMFAGIMSLCFFI